MAPLQRRDRVAIPARSPDAMLALTDLTPSSITFHAHKRKSRWCVLTAYLRPASECASPEVWEVERWPDPRLRPAIEIGWVIDRISAGLAEHRPAADHRQLC